MVLSTSTEKLWTLIKVFYIKLRNCNYDLNFLRKISIAILLFTNVSQAAPPYEEAAKKTLEAIYIHNKIDVMLTQYAENNLPPELRDLIVQWSFYGKFIIEKKVEYTWKF